MNLDTLNANNSRRYNAFVLLIILFTLSIIGCQQSYQPASLWKLAQRSRDDLVVTTLFIESTVSKDLSTEQGVEKAIDWCKFHGITKVYLETFRNGRQASGEILLGARDMFEDAGFEVSGCVTTTQVGKAASYVDENGQIVEGHLACYKAAETEKAISDVFEFTASFFDEIIIDDFYCTDCKCQNCIEAKGDRSWSEYRSDLMLDISKDFVLPAARRVNPDCKIIIKYPNWYDHYISAGYDTYRQTELFPYIYTGTETREPDESGSNPQYGGYFLMQWLNNIGQGKNRGGWFDYIDTRPDTFVEQAIQTVLGQADEIMLFRYAPLASPAEQADIDALHEQLPGLFKLAGIIKNKTAQGIVAPKPPKSSDRHEKTNKLGQDKYLLSFAGMIGLPLVPTVKLSDNAQMAMFTQHSLYDQEILSAMRDFAASGRPILVTDGLLAALDLALDASADNVHVLEVKDSNKRILSLSSQKLNLLRDSMLEPLGVKFHAPARVAIYLYDCEVAAIENFNNNPVEVSFGKEGVENYENILSIPADSEVDIKQLGSDVQICIPARSLIVIHMD